MSRPRMARFALSSCCNKVVTSAIAEKAVRGVLDTAGAQDIQLPVLRAAIHSRHNFALSLRPMAVRSCLVLAVSSYSAALYAAQSRTSGIADQDKLAARAARLRPSY